ncbi:MAG: hypothetical protein M1405_03210 [Patescibacteria group bacterium]|nr:hypothetical protein [Patescibacteria group bacterium]
MSRNLCETGITGRMDAPTIGRNDSPLAKRLKTDAQIRALRDTGVKIDLFVSALGEATPGVVSSNGAKPQ